MRYDRVTRILLCLVVIGLFANAFATLLQPQPAEATCYGATTSEIWEIGSCLEDIQSILSDIESDASDAASSSDMARYYAYQLLQKWELKEKADKLPIFKKR